MSNINVFIIICLVDKNINIFYFFINLCGKLHKITNKNVILNNFYELMYINTNIIQSVKNYKIYIYKENYKIIVKKKKIKLQVSFYFLLIHSNHFYDGDGGHEIIYDYYFLKINYLIHQKQHQIM